jgi:hypothetical protein
MGYIPEAILFLPVSLQRRVTKSVRLIAAVALLCGSPLTLGALAVSPDESNQARAPREGQHDFDFNMGVWHTHIRRVLDPFAGSTQSMELNGTVFVRKVWDGSAQLEEIEADGPKGHWEGLTLFLYNPQSHQWSQSFINSKMGELSAPLIGAFKHGRGELFSQDTFHGKTILVRGVWSHIEAEAHHYEESYSADGGKTWAAAFIADLTRDTQAAGNRSSAEVQRDAERTGADEDGQRDFDFDFGNWKTKSSRLLHPLTGSKDWMQLDGTTVVRRVWDGRANLAEYKADGSAGPIELLSLRWFNPTTHEWNIDFATPKVGTLGIPAAGRFKNGRGDFYDYEMIDGRSVLVRFSIWSITADNAQSEQAFSDDGGKTWEVNWINKYQRVRQ